MAVDNEYLEHHLGSLMTTAGTDLGDVTAVAPEVVKRARRRIDVDELFDAVRAGNRTHISPRHHAAGIQCASTSSAGAGAAGSPVALLGECPPSRHHRRAWRWQIYVY